MRASPSPRRSGALFAIAVTVLTAAAMVTPGAAFAHDVLISSSPAADESVESLPGHLTLSFSAQLIAEPGATIVEVTGPDGSPAHTSEPVIDGAEVTVPLVAEAPAGEYRVVWRVVSSDGHPISGEFSFTVRTSTLLAPPVTPSVTPSPEPSIPEHEAPAGGLPLGVVAGIIGVGAIGLLLAVLFLVKRRSGAADEG